MSLRNILIAVSDIELSKRFYHDVFGLTPIRDFGSNVILTEGLVLQDKQAWGQELHETIVAGNASELFFEENDLGAFLLRLKAFDPDIRVSDIYVNPWDRRCVKLHDPDGHLIEVAEHSMIKDLNRQFHE